MALKADRLLHEMAKELRVSEETLPRQGLRTFLQRELRTVQAGVFEICDLYSVSNAEEMGSRYEKGSLEEANSWQDLQRLDHLE